MFFDLLSLSFVRFALHSSAFRGSYNDASKKDGKMKPWKFELLMKPPAKPLTEGPVWDGEHLYFTHIQASRILRYDPKSGEITVARENTNKTNGLCYDAKGNLFGCCS